MAKKQAQKATDPIKVGTAYLFRGVTNYYLGRVVAIHEDIYELEDASWVADTGRFHEALAKGKLNENEPYPGHVLVFKSSLCDASPWIHKLPYGVA